MTRVLETCGPDTYANAKGQPEWKQAMSIEMDSRVKCHTWDLVP
jgi:hypothetical protein